MIVLAVKPCRVFGCLHSTVHLHKEYHYWFDCSDIFSPGQGSIYTLERLGSCHLFPTFSSSLHPHSCPQFLPSPLILILRSSIFSFFCSRTTLVQLWCLWSAVSFPGVIQWGALVVNIFVGITFAVYANPLCIEGKMVGPYHILWAFFRKWGSCFPIARKVHAWHEAAW